MSIGALMLYGYIVKNWTIMAPEIHALETVAALSLQANGVSKPAYNLT
jgi:hypothetical protein